MKKFSIEYLNKLKEELTLIEMTFSAVESDTSIQVKGADFKDFRKARQHLMAEQIILKAKIKVIEDYLE